MYISNYMDKIWMFHSELGKYMNNYEHIHLLSGVSQQGIIVDRGSNQQTKLKIN